MSHEETVESEIDFEQIFPEDKEAAPAPEKPQEKVTMRRAPPATKPRPLSGAFSRASDMFKSKDKETQPASSPDLGATRVTVTTRRPSSDQSQVKTLTANYVPPQQSNDAVAIAASDTQTVSRGYDSHSVTTGKDSYSTSRSSGSDTYSETRSSDQFTASAVSETHSSTRQSTRQSSNNSFSSSTADRQSSSRQKSRLGRIGIFKDNN